MSSSRVDAVEIVAAVTEPTRRQLLDLLLEGGESTPTALAKALPVTRQAVSKHLAVLERAGLIDGERSGREIHYRVNVERLDAATRSLSELASTWDRRLLRIKRLAEAAHAERRRRNR
jgi:ArsR family transcriptional regulator, cadmium/lead-responsive transcriptional repressor